MYAVLPDGSALGAKDAVTLNDIRDLEWILFEKKAHPLMYDTILRRAAEEGISIRGGQRVLQAEDAAQLVRERSGVAFVGPAGAMRIAERGALVRPISDPALVLEVCLATIADNRSKLVRVWRDS